MYSFSSAFICFVFFFNDTATTEIYTLSLHDALPIGVLTGQGAWGRSSRSGPLTVMLTTGALTPAAGTPAVQEQAERGAAMREAAVLQGAELVDPANGEDRHGHDVCGAWMLPGQPAGEPGQPVGGHASRRPDREIAHHEPGDPYRPSALDGPGVQRGHGRHRRER